MNKKGISKVFMNAIMAIAATAVVITTVIIYVSNAIELHTQTHQLEVELLHQRLIGALSATEQVTGRTMFGMIDDAKFSDDTLQENMAGDTIAVRLTLIDFEDKTTSEIFYNKDFFDRYSTRFQGIEGAQKKIYVTVAKRDAIHPAALEMDALIERKNP